MSGERSTPPRLSPRQRVLKKYPEAKCIEVSGCTFAVFKHGVIDSNGWLAFGHSTTKAWAEAARNL